MTTPLPQFANPPVSETVLGVQFHPLPGLQSAHLAEFWTGLGPEWSDIQETAPLGQTIEPTGDENLWLPPSIALRMTKALGVRLRAARTPRDRMIQVENGWFVYNWTKLGPKDPYPGYDRVKPEFDDYLERFKKYLLGKGLGEFQPNLWEVGYINSLPRGDLWNDVADWAQILQPLLASFAPTTVGPLRTLGGRWAFSLKRGAGRLQILLEHVRQEHPEVSELLLLRLVARGPLSEPSPAALEAGLSLGHEAIVTTFAELVSEDVRRYWGHQA